MAVAAPAPTEAALAAAAMPAAPANSFKEGALGASAARLLHHTGANHHAALTGVSPPPIAAAACCPRTDNRRLFVRRRAAEQFRAARDLTDQEAAFAVQLAETQLENLQKQCQILNDLAKEDNLKGPRG